MGNSGPTFGSVALIAFRQREHLFAAVVVKHLVLCVFCIQFCSGFFGGLYILGLRETI